MTTWHYTWLDHLPASAISFVMVVIGDRQAIMPVEQFLEMHYLPDDAKVFYQLDDDAIDRKCRDLLLRHFPNYHHPQYIPDL